MATLNPAAVQNEDIHMLRGKGVEGAKLGIVQNENIHIHKGKGIEGFKAEKPTKPLKRHERKALVGLSHKLGMVQNENIHIHKGKGIEGFKDEKRKPLKRHERKALVDLSHAGKPLGSTTTSSKGAAPKEKSFANKNIGLTEKSKLLKHHEPKALGDLSHAGKPLDGTTPSKGTATAKKAEWYYNRLTDEQVAKCEEWAEDGIEYMPYSSNDMHKLEEQRFEERVNREVDEAMSGLRVWNDVTFGLNFPQDVPSDDEKTIHLEFEPEILSYDDEKATLGHLSSDYKGKGVDDLFGLDDAEFDSLFFSPPQYELKLEDLKLKDESEDGSGIC